MTSVTCETKVPDLQPSSENSGLEIYVSNIAFSVESRLLSKYPATRLSALAKSNESGTTTVHHFDADPDIFKEVLKFYHSGELHCPKNSCVVLFQEQLEFWGIDFGHISDCCIAEVGEQKEIEAQFAYFDRRIRGNLEQNPSNCTRFRYQVWSFLSDPSGQNKNLRRLALGWAAFYFILTLGNGLCVALETLPSLWKHQSYNQSYSGTIREPKRSGIQDCDDYSGRQYLTTLKVLSSIDTALTIFFAVEIWIRFLCCPHKLKFWKTVHGLDMVISNVECVTLGYFLFINHHLIPRRHLFVKYDTYCAAASYVEIVSLVFGQARLLRLLSYASIYSGLKVLLITLYRSWREILLLVILLGMAVLMFGPLVYYLAESSSESNNITSIPHAYWFIMVTMTTVGYGDTYPVTVGACIATAIVMIAGLMVTALPVAIVGRNFTIVYEYNESKGKQISRAKVRGLLQKLDGVDV